MNDFSSLKKLAGDLRALPITVAQRVASDAAPALSQAAKTTFDAGEDADGVPWAPAKDGSRVRLRKTGALESRVYYVAIGTKLRVTLGVPYAKYQIGKRPVFPRQGAILPPAYRQALAKATVSAIRSSGLGR